jgi:two-component system chemotaxis sensor kinase CheA
MQDEIINDFLIESAENLASLDREFVLLEKQGNSRELLGSIFRTIHTIKGTAGFFDFKKLVAITHFAEDILAKMRDGKMAVRPAIVDALLASVDAVKEVLANIEATSTEGDKDYSGIVDRLKKFAENPDAVPDSNATAKSVTNGASVPTATVTEPAATEKPAPQAAVLPAAPAAPETQDAAHDDAAPAPASATSDASNAAAEHTRPSVADSTIRVEVAILDRLMNLVGELVLTRNQILQFATVNENKAVTSSSQRLNLITTELQENVMKTRMQPIGGIWNKLPRLVRDISQSMSKEVDLHMEGTTTELDKTILEAVKDPFTHIVRNAIDHGIETPEERVKKGKPRRGSIHLRAFHEGGQVNIDICDDGAGINLQRVKRKAVSQGMITEDQAARLSEREALHLIFRPGFSTAEKITAISGRGVGMDVVKTNIEKIGGVVDLVNNPGHGATIKIKIPLTLAIIPALIVTAKNERFAIPQINLRELVRLEGDGARKGIEMVQGIEVYRLRGKLLPLVRLRHLLKLDDNPAGEPASDVVNIVVLAADNRFFGVVVDGINDTEEIVVKPLSKQLKNIPAFAGSTIMGDGKVALILDAVGMITAS